jgi:hypothetical protein
VNAARRTHRWFPLLVLPLLVACGGGGGSSGPSGSSQFLIQHNARFNDGFTVRWASLPIQVFTGSVASPGEVTEWTAASGGRVTFTFVGGPPSSGITFRFGDPGPDNCGTTTVRFPDGNISSGDVTVNQAIYRGPQCVRSITHETGHAIGFLDHTADGGLMDTDGGNGEITPSVAQMFRDLYSLAPMTFVGLAERARVAPRRARGREMVFVHPARR